MFFVGIGRVVAWLAFVLGFLRAGMGLLALSSNDPELFAQRYLGKGTIGEDIDQGIYAMLFGIGLGIATEIAKTLRRLAKAVEDQNAAQYDEE